MCVWSLNCCWLILNDDEYRADVFAVRCYSFKRLTICLYCLNHYRRFDVIAQNLPHLCIQLSRNRAKWLWSGSVDSDCPFSASSGRMVFPRLNFPTRTKWHLHFYRSRQDMRPRNNISSRLLLFARNPSCWKCFDSVFTKVLIFLCYHEISWKRMWRKSGYFSDS